MSYRTSTVRACSTPCSRSSCPGCGTRGLRGAPVCPACAQGLRRPPPVLPPPGVDHWAAPFTYDGVARELVARVKYRNVRAAVPWLADRMVESLPAGRPGRCRRRHVGAHHTGSPPASRVRSGRGPGPERRASSAPALPCAPPPPPGPAADRALRFRAARGPAPRADRQHAGDRAPRRRCRHHRRDARCRGAGAPSRRRSRGDRAHRGAYPASRPAVAGGAPRPASYTWPRARASVRCRWRSWFGARTVRCPPTCATCPARRSPGSRGSPTMPDASRSTSPRSAIRGRRDRRSARSRST